MLIDYHIHTKLCKHAVGEPEDYVREALKKGIDEIGFADHMPMPSGYDPENRMIMSQYSEYISMIKDVQSRFHDIEIKFGIEADYFAPHVDFVRKFLDEQPFDYVLGSVHYMDWWGFDNEKNIFEYNNRDITDVYQEYFDTVKAAAETNLFDIIAHFDLVKKFGFRPDNGYIDIAYDVLKVIKDNDLCVEVNTSGLRKQAQEVYPSDEVLKKVCELDIPITLGSDSHKPEEVGWHFNETIEKLKSIGFTKVCRFSERKRTFVTL